MCFEMLKSSRGSRQIFSRESKCSRHYEKSFSNNNTMYRANQTGDDVIINVNEISRFRKSFKRLFVLSPIITIITRSIKLRFGEKNK